MTLGAQTAALGLLIVVSACSIQNDVPGFTYPPSTLTGAVTEQPVLQPTADLIVDNSEDTKIYEGTIAQLDGQAYRLRQAVQAPSEP